MKNRSVLLALFLLAHVSLIAQDFMAGAAIRTINPDKDSLYLAGGKPNRPFIDVHDDLYVKAIVVSNSKNNITLLTFDCIGLLYPQLQEIRARIKSELAAVLVSSMIVGWQAKLVRVAIFFPFRSLNLMTLTALSSSPGSEIFFTQSSPNEPFP